MSTHIAVQQHGAVLEIKIDRPERKNALTRSMYLEIARILDEAAANQAVKVILLTGQADIFCAGNDLSEFIDPPQRALDCALRFMRSLYCVEKPVIAAVAGAAVGVGATMLLHCDLVYAGESAKLSFPFVLLGACPEFGSTRTLTRLLGHQRAMEVAMFGGALSADKLREWGLVNEVVADADLYTHALEKAHNMAKLSSGAVTAAKKLMRRSEPDMLALFEEEAREFVALAQLPESQAAINLALNRSK